MASTSGGVSDVKGDALQSHSAPWRCAVVQSSATGFQHKVPVPPGPPAGQSSAPQENLVKETGLVLGSASKAHTAHSASSSLLWLLERMPGTGRGGSTGGSESTLWQKMLSTAARLGPSTGASHHEEQPSYAAKDKACWAAEPRKHLIPESWRSKERRTPSGRAPTHGDQPPTADLHD